MSDYDYLQNKRNMIVGAFVIVGLLVFAYMIFIFGELPVTVTKLTSYNVKVRFPSAPGVQENTPVQYCGYQIGRVTYVSPPIPYEDKQDKFIHQVTADIAIDKKYNTIPSNSKARLFRRGLGSSYIDFSNDPMTAQELEALKPKYIEQGMVLQGQFGAGNEIIPEALQEKMGTLFTKISILADNINVVVGDVNNQQNVKNSLANLAKATEESVATLAQIREFTQSGQQNLTSVSNSITQASDELGETLIELRRTLTKINSGEGTVGKLINDGKLYENLLDSSEELKLSLENLKKTLHKTSEKGIQLKLF